MSNEKTKLRMLTAGIVFISMVIISIVFIVIPHVKLDTTPQATPESAVPVLWVTIGIRLLVVTCLIWALIANKRRQNINREILLVAGIISILIGLVTLDAASAYLGHLPPMPKVAILLFGCVGFDIISGIMIIVSRFFQKKRQTK